MKKISKNCYDVPLKTISEERHTMLHDVKLEKDRSEMFAGRCQLGRRFGIPTPVNDALFQKISALEVKESF